MIFEDLGFRTIEGTDSHMDNLAKSSRVGRSVGYESRSLGMMSEEDEEVEED